MFPITKFIKLKISKHTHAYISEYNGFRKFVISLVVQPGVGIIA